MNGLSARSHLFVWGTVAVATLLLLWVIGLYGITLGCRDLRK